MKHAKDKNNSDDSFGLRDTLVWCGIPIIIVLLIRIFLLGFYVIPSGSMMNTIEPGDRVITSKLTPKVFDLKRGDVVVFKDPDHWLRQGRRQNWLSLPSAGPATCNCRCPTMWQTCWQGFRTATPAPC